MFSARLSRAVAVSFGLMVHASCGSVTPPDNNGGANDAGADRGGAGGAAAIDGGAARVDSGAGGSAGIDAGGVRDAGVNSVSDSGSDANVATPRILFRGGIGVL